MAQVQENVQFTPHKFTSQDLAQIEIISYL